MLRIGDRFVLLSPVYRRLTSADDTDIVAPEGALGTIIGLPYGESSLVFAALLDNYKTPSEWARINGYFYPNGYFYLSVSGVRFISPLEELALTATESQIQISP